MDFSAKVYSSDVKVDSRFLAEIHQVPYVQWRKSIPPFEIGKADVESA